MAGKVLADLWNYSASLLPRPDIRHCTSACWAAAPTVDDGSPLRHVPVMTATKLDLTGLKCPLPALKTRKALKALTPGDLLEVQCTDPLSVIDIPNLLRETGDRLDS